jgi:23S rRNA (guanine745-N1)-methyltransferase
VSFLESDRLRCPIDQLALRQDGNSVRCDSGHSFDIARQGYINLLAASDKRTKDPGDSKEMIAARRAFLSAGHYRPIADKLAELVLPGLAPAPVIVDAGCGEGYYLEQLIQRLPQAEGSAATVIGFDISKWAVQAAARRLPASWLVASNRNIPVVAGSADVVLSLFGFPAYDSFQRILKKAATLLLVSAGPRHLIELREVIYPVVNSSDSSEGQQAQTAGFCPIESVNLQYSTADLNPMEIGQLLLMTPHLFRASREGRERAASLEQLSVTVDVRFDLLRSPDAEN